MHGYSSTSYISHEADAASYLGQKLTSTWFSAKPNTTINYSLVMCYYVLSISQACFKQYLTYCVQCNFSSDNFLKFAHQYFFKSIFFSVVRSKARQIQRSVLSRTNENIYKTTFHNFSGCWRGGSRNEKHLSCLYCNTSMVQTREIFISKASASRTKRRESMEAARLETFQSRLWSFAEWWEPGERERAKMHLRLSIGCRPIHFFLTGPHKRLVYALSDFMELTLVHVHALFVTYSVRLERAKKEQRKATRPCWSGVQQVNRC